MFHTPFHRRRLLQAATGAAAASLFPAALARPAAGESLVRHGRIRQSVAAWCFTKTMSLDVLAGHVAAMGVKSIELVDPKDWPILKRHGLICAIVGSHGFAKGFNDKAHHAWATDLVKRRVDDCAAAGFPNVIVFSGFRRGIADDVGLDNMVEGLKPAVAHAEKQKVTLCLEVLNSRVDVEMKGHPDYMADRVEWAVEVCKRIGSPRMKILFDIYHVQIMQGDVITRIRQFHEYVGHYHTAGVPGRNELDDAQEINYPPILREIVKTGYTGYVGQEFIPTRDPIESLAAAVRLCDI